MTNITIGFVPRERFSSAAESLESILTETDTPYEMLIVDCATPPAVWAEIETLIEGRDNVRVLHTDHILLPNEAKNLVINETKTEYLCLIENDNLVEPGWLDKLSAFVTNGGHVLGICGGYQMLGSYVHDPEGLEGTPGSTRGLELLPVETVLKAPKTTTLTRFQHAETVKGTGYEIHMGQTRRLGGNPWFKVVERNNIACEDADGCVSPDQKIMGTYLHGLFENPAVTRLWLDHIGLPGIKTATLEGVEAKDREYDLLAEYFESHIDVDGIRKLVPQNGKAVGEKIE